MNESENKQSVSQLPLMAVLGCPFCGEQPDIATDGTQLEFYCCCSMSFQKCDYLTLDERGTFSYETYKYSDEAEEKVMKIAVERWNARVQPNIGIQRAVKQSAGM
jgi:hypothetical protein